MPTLIAYLKLFRLPLVFTAIADSWAAYLLFTSLSWRDLGLLALASAGLYAFGMGMNDVADRERDRTQAPGRPIPSGRVSVRGALTACGLALVVSLAAVLQLRFVTPWILGAWGAVVVAILAYDFWLKFPPVMGLVRTHNYLMGACAGWLGPGMIDAIRPMHFPYLGGAHFLYGTALTFVSTLEDGPVRKGRLWLGVAGMIAAVVFPLGLFFKPWGLLPAGLLVLWILFRAARAVDKKGVMLLVRDGVAGFIFLDSTLVLTLGHERTGAGLLLLLWVVPAFGLMQVFKRLP